MALIRSMKMTDLVTDAYREAYAEGEDQPIEAHGHGQGVLPLVRVVAVLLQQLGYTGGAIGGQLLAGQGRAVGIQRLVPEERSAAAALFLSIFTLQLYAWVCQRPLWVISGPKWFP